MIRDYFVIRVPRETLSVVVSWKACITVVDGMWQMLIVKPSR